MRNPNTLKGTTDGTGYYDIKMSKPVGELVQKEVVIMVCGKCETLLSDPVRRRKKYLC